MEEPIVDEPEKRPRREEINAYNKYSTTAQHARPIRQTATTAQHQRPGLRQRWKSGTLDEDGKWSTYFDDKKEAGLYTQVVEGTQGKGEGGDVDTKKQKDLTVNVQKRIRSMFGVYFTHPHSNEFSRDLSGYHEDQNALLQNLSMLLGTMPWLPPWIEDNLPIPRFFLFIELSLRGIGQVFFCNSPLSGLLIAVGLYVQSTRVATHGIIGLVSGNLAAMACGFDAELIQSGLFGYNAILIGLALATFDNTQEHQGWSVAVPLVTAFLAGFSTLVFVLLGNLLIPYKAPPLTLPLDMITVVFLASTNTMPRISVGPVFQPGLPEYPEYEDVDLSHIDTKGFFLAVMRGIGQIVFCDKTAACILIIVGITVCSRIAVSAAVLGSAVGAAMVLAVGIDHELVELGVVNFQATLVVLAAFMFYVPGKGLVALALAGAVAVTFLQQGLETFFSTFGLVYVTFPFCLITLVNIILQGTTTLAVAVPLEAMSIPEDHLQRLEVLKEGFGLLSAVAAEDEGSEFKLTRSVDIELDKISKAILQDGSRTDLTTDGKPTMKARNPNRDLFFAMSDGSSEIQLSDFVSCLRSSGLVKPEGLRFAAGVFFLLDKDGSGTIDLDEFLTICRVSKLLPPIRHRLAHFFEFVDMDGNGTVSFDEIDASLAYLGEKPLSAEIRDGIIRLAGLDTEEDEVSVVQFMNIIAAANIKRLTKKLHQNQRRNATV